MQGPLDDSKSSSWDEKTRLTTGRMLPEPLRPRLHGTPINIYGVPGNNSSPSERPIADSPRPQACTKPHAKTEEEKKGKEKKDSDSGSWSDSEDENESESESDEGQKPLNFPHLYFFPSPKILESAKRNNPPFVLPQYVFPSNDKNLPAKTTACTFYVWNDGDNSENNGGHSPFEDERDTFMHRVDQEFFKLTARPTTLGATSYCMNFRELPCFLLKVTGALINIGKPPALPE